jgi:hypothetical protein
MKTKVRLLRGPMLRLARIKPAGMLQIKSAELKNSKAELI